MAFDIQRRGSRRGDDEVCRTGHPAELQAKPCGGTCLLGLGKVEGNGVVNEDRRARARQTRDRTEATGVEPRVTGRKIARLRTESPGQLLAVGDASPTRGGKAHRGRLGPRPERPSPSPQAVDSAGARLRTFFEQVLHPLAVEKNGRAANARERENGTVEAYDVIDPGTFDAVDTGRRTAADARDCPADVENEGRQRYSAALPMAKTQSR